MTIKKIVIITSSVSSFIILPRSILFKSSSFGRFDFLDKSDGWVWSLSATSSFLAMEKNIWNEGDTRYLASVYLLL